MSSKMSRRGFLKVTAAAGAGLTLAACGSAAETPGATDATASTAGGASAPAAASAAPAGGQAVNLRFAILPDQGEQKNVENLVAAYNKLYPNVNVKVEQLSGDYFQKLQLDASSGTLADVFWIHDQGTKQYAEKGLMLELDTFMAENTSFKKEDVYPSMLALGQYDGKQYMMPRDYNHLVTFYNQNMFEEGGVPLPKDGWGWDEMVDAARKLTKKEGDVTTQYGIDGSNFNWWAMAVPAIRGHGGEVVDESGKVVVDSDEAAAGIDALYQLAKEGIATNYAEAPSDTFNTAKCAMFFHVRPILSGVMEAAKDKWDPGVATFPKFPVAGAVGTGTSGYAASAKTPFGKEAAALVLFIASPEGQKVFNATGNAIPVLQSLSNDDSWRSVPNTTINQDAFVKFPEWDSLPVETRIPAGAAAAYDTSRTELMEQVFLGKLSARDMVAEWAKRIQTGIDEA